MDNSGILKYKASQLNSQFYLQNRHPFSASYLFITLFCFRHLNGRLSLLDGQISATVDNSGILKYKASQLNSQFYLQNRHPFSATLFCFRHLNVAISFLDGQISATVHNSGILKYKASQLNFPVLFAKQTSFFS